MDNTAEQPREISSLLYQVGLLLTSDLDLPQVLQRVLETAIEVVNADIASIHTYYADLDRLGFDPFRRVATIGASRSQATYAPPRPDGQTYRIARQKMPLFSNNAQGDPVFQDSPFTAHEQIQSVAGIPLIKGEEAVGVLYFNFKQSGQITEHKLETMQLFANQAALAIANARLFEEAREREDGLHQLLTLGDKIREATAHGFDRVLQATVDAANEILSADCAVLYPYDPGRNTFYDVGRVARAGTLREPFRLSDKPRKMGMASYVRKKGMVVVNDIEREDPKMLKSNFIQRERIKAFVGVSLVAGDAELGVLYVNFRQPHYFSDSEQDIIQVLGNHAAVALQNARQIKALQEAQQQRLAAEAWATLGKAVANLAHRINNTTGVIPLAVQSAIELLGNLELESEQFEPIESDLKRIDRNARFTLDLASELLNPFRNAPEERLDLQSVIHQAIDLAGIPTSVGTQLDLAPEIPPVYRSVLLLNVFVELLSNAVKAMPNGGKIRVCTRLLPGYRVSIEVTDTGCGIAEDDLPRIFDLFFTRGTDGKGYGLWWVKTFLLQQSGTIDVTSKLDVGTTFTITLPLDEELESSGGILAEQGGPDDEEYLGRG